MAAEFERGVFVNCPLDEAYEPVLQAILFCIVHLGFEPSLASGRADSGEDRLTKIIALMEGCKYSIHDLTRARAEGEGEMFRMNMPFELGIDYASRRYSKELKDKKFLVFERVRFEAKAALSDLSGCDFETHEGRFEKAIGEVRNFLVNEAGVRNDGTSLIVGRYADFQEWYWESQLAAGSSEDDIRRYPTREVLRAMQEWANEGTRNDIAG